MEKRVTTSERIFLSNGAALAWIAVFFQLYLIIVNRTASIPETITRFFSFFTILSNILVALCFTYRLLKPNAKWGRFFSRPTTQTAIALYIGVTGIIYNTILRALWKPEGLQFLVNELLHSVIPVLFILYWLFFVPKESLKWTSIFPWLIFPTVYCIYSIIRGAIAGVYPYPFLDAKELGYNKVILNICGVTVVFIVLSLLLVAIAKLIARSPGSKGL
ncbi:MAG: Pr6Pr family membrane protein [Ferruginibacter sp.]